MLYALAHMLMHVCFQRHDFGIFLHLVVRTVESLSRMDEAPHWLALALVSTWPWIYPFLERIYLPQSLWMLYQSPWQKFSLWCVNEGGCIGKGSDNWAAGSSGLSHAVGQVWVWLSIRLWHKIWIWDHLIVHRIRDSVKAVDTPITGMPRVFSSMSHPQVDMLRFRYICFWPCNRSSFTLTSANILTPLGTSCRIFTIPPVTRLASSKQTWI